MNIKKHRIERIKINNSVIAIRVIIHSLGGSQYSKQFVVNNHMTEQQALLSAREYVAMMKQKPVAIPSDKEVIKVAEKIVIDAQKRDAHNANTREAAKKDVQFVLKRYATTSVYGYFNASGEWTQ